MTKNISKLSKQSSKLFYKLINEAIDRPFSGWDFSYITKTNRMTAPQPKRWNYVKIIKHFMRKGDNLLDMGTGGGETLQKLEPLPPNTYATETYGPNVLVAKKNLEQLKVKVIQTFAGERLPFPNDKFDLIINRHDNSFNCNEIARILKKQGKFITQQVVGLIYLYELYSLLDMEFKNKFNRSRGLELKKIVKQLQEVGLKITYKDEQCYYLRFHDIGALYYFLKAFPWQIGKFYDKDFNYKNFSEPLKKIHNRILEKGYIDLKSPRLIVIAQKS